MLPVETPFKIYTGLDGKPLNNGYVYFGQPNQNPITAPVTVYWDAAGTQPAAQPLRTVNGYIVRAGTPANVFFDGSYSELVRDSKGAQVFYARTSDDFSIATVVLNFLTFVNAFITQLASAVGASLVGFILNALGAVARSVQDKLSDTVSAFDFMTPAQIADVKARTLTLNVSASVQAWVTHCYEKKKTGYAPSGSYKITAQVLKPAAFFAPILYGDGATSTIFDYSGDAATACLKIKGGSGSAADSYITGIGFDCTDTTYGIEIADQCAYQVKGCRLISGAIGILLHNESPDGFTEYVVAEGCTFDPTCSQALVYKRTGGNDSFHGSGLRNCQINESTTETLPKIEIGGALSTSQDIIVYNSELSIQCWKQTTTPFLRNNSPRTSINFHGDLTFETFGGGQFDIASGASLTYYAGTITEINNTVRRGQLVLCDTFSTRADGAQFAFRKPYKQATEVMAAGAVANDVCELYSIAEETYLVRAVFQSSASPWRRVFLLAVHISPATSTVTTIGDLMNYFGGDYVSPVFSMTGTTLIATGDVGWPAATISCEISVSQVGHCAASVL